MATTTLRARRLYNGAGTTIDDAFLRVEDGKVTTLGRVADLGSAASGARDLGDVTLLPGLVNMHTHLTCSCSANVLADALNDSYEVKMMRAVENARAALLSGVTTIRDCGTLNPIVFAIRAASAQGLIAAPHVWASGEVLTSTGGHCYFFGVECDSIDDVKRAVRRQVKAGADYVKVMATGGGLTPNTNPREAQFTREEMIAIVEDSARIGKLVAAHCHGTPGIRNAIDARVRTIEHCSFMVPTPAGIEYEQPLVDEIAAAGIYVCPTIGVGERMRRRQAAEGQFGAWEATRAKRLEALRRLWQSGVVFVSGNDAGMALTGFDDFQLDLELLVEHIGMSAEQALQSATSKAAAAIGSDAFGVLAPGRRADVIAARGNPLDDISALRNLALIMKAGEIVAG